MQKSKQNVQKWNKSAVLEGYVRREEKSEEIATFWSIIQQDKLK